MEESAPLRSRHGQEGVEGWGFQRAGRSILLAFGVVAAVTVVGTAGFFAQYGVMGGGPVALSAQAKPAVAVQPSFSPLPAATALKLQFHGSVVAVKPGVGGAPEVVYYTPELQQPAAAYKQQILAQAADSAQTADSAGKKWEFPSTSAPKVEDMHRAIREVRDDRDKRRLRMEDFDHPEQYTQPHLDGTHDHHYYSGPGTNRQIPTTDIRGQLVVSNPVASIPYPASGSAIATQQAIYAPKLPPLHEHDVHDDIHEAALDHPTREMVARALEHIQSREIGTEFFHDTLVDNDPSSYHYQQHIHVHHVAGSKDDNGILSWNGIGGIFGTGGLFGPKEGRDDVDLHGKKTLTGRIVWHGNEPLDVERIMQTGSKFGEISGDEKDIAQQVLRNAIPDLNVQANKFLNYNPAHPPPKARDNYVHTWAAYTPKGSQIRMRAEQGQETYLEWKKEHPKQAWYAMHGVPCFNGKVPCKETNYGYDNTAGGAYQGSGGQSTGAVAAK